MKKNMHIICHYRKKKGGLPDWVVPYLLVIIDFLFWLYLLLTIGSNIKPLLIIWSIGLAGISFHLLIRLLFSIHSPIKRQKWRKLLQIFSEYSDLIAENKPTRWKVSLSKDKDIIKYMPAGSVSKTMSNLEIDVAEKLTQFLEVKTNKIWDLRDTITDRSSITLVYKHNELSRKEVDFHD